MANIPSLVAPASKTWLGLDRELTTGTPVLPGSVTTGNPTTMPLDKSTYEPEDMPHWLPDEAIRGTMARMFAEIQGVEEASWSLGGPMFGDVYGYFFDNVFGDTSTVGSTPTSSTTLSSPTVIGATTCTVASGVGYSTGSVVQIDTGALAEVVKLSTVVSNTLNFTNYPLRFPHSAAATVSIVTGPYTHKFATLNSGDGQPPTHTATDYTSLTTTVGARSYPSLCIAQIDLTGSAEQLYMAKVTGTSWISAPATSAPTKSTAFTVPIPGWRPTITVGGTPVYSVGEWSISIKRELQVYFTAQGAQNPYIIARGTLDATGNINYTVPSDESPLTQMLNNTQPPVVITIDNGQVGTANINFAITCSQAAFIKAKPVRSSVLVGYEDEWQSIANTTDVGGSGGWGQITVALTNNVPSY